MGTRLAVLWDGRCKIFQKLSKVESGMVVVVEGRLERGRGQSSKYHDWPCLVLPLLRILDTSLATLGFSATFKTLIAAGIA